MGLEQFGRVHRHQTYVVSGKQAEWVQIWFRGQTSWVRGSYTVPQ